MWTLGDGDFIELDGVFVWRCSCSGHAPGHIVLVDDRSMSAIVGDMVAGIGTIIIDPDDAGDMRAYMDSLRQLREIEPSCLMPSHGPVIGGAEAKLTAYLHHRQERENRILDAVKNTDGSLTSVVDHAYHDTPVILRSGPGGGLAGRSALAHLIKLVKDGRVSGTAESGFDASDS